MRNKKPSQNSLREGILSLHRAVQELEKVGVIVSPREVLYGSSITGPIPGDADVFVIVDSVRPIPRGVTLSETAQKLYDGIADVVLHEEKYARVYGNSMNLLKEQQNVDIVIISTKSFLEHLGKKPEEQKMKVLLDLTAKGLWIQHNYEEISDMFVLFPLFQLASESIPAEEYGKKMLGLNFTNEHIWNSVQIKVTQWLDYLIRFNHMRSLLRQKEYDPDKVPDWDTDAGLELALALEEFKNNGQPDEETASKIALALRRFLLEAPKVLAQVRPEDAGLLRKVSASFSAGLWGYLHNANFIQTIFLNGAQLLYGENIEATDAIRKIMPGVGSYIFTEEQKIQSPANLGDWAKKAQMWFFGLWTRLSKGDRETKTYESSMPMVQLLLPRLTPPQQAILDLFPDATPKEFYQQATRVAQWMTLLDDPKTQKQAMNDEDIRIFIEQLVNSEFVHKSPSAALPVWLQEEFVQQHGIPLISSKQFPTDQSMKALWTEFGKAYGKKPEDILGDLYYSMVIPNSTLDSAFGLKVYIDDAYAARTLSDGTLKKAMDELISRGLAPKDIKLYHDNNRIVMYFLDATQDISQVLDVFKMSGIHIRGPAMDVYNLIASSRTVFASNMPRYSNDGSLDPVKGMEYSGDLYNQTELFKKYISMVLQSGKRPDRPYEISFFYVDTSNLFNKPVVADIIKQAAMRTSLPVVIGAELSLQNVRDTNIYESSVQTPGPLKQVGRNYLGEAWNWIKSKIQRDNEIELSQYTENYAIDLLRNPLFVNKSYASQDEMEKAIDEHLTRYWSQSTSEMQEPKTKTERTKLIRDVGTRLQTIHSSKLELSQFMKDVWMHPLVNDQTLRHRKLGGDTFIAFLQNHNLDPDAYAYIPVGSTVWITTPESDYDFVLLAKNEIARRAFENLVHSKPEDFEPLNMQASVSLDKLNSTSLKEMYANTTRFHFLSLLFTPDEYIGGNVSLAQQTRLPVLREFMWASIYDPVYQLPEEQRAIHNYFSQYYSYWAFSWEGLQYTKQQVREERLDAAIRELAIQRDIDPTIMTKLFHQYLFNMPPPKFFTIQEALLASQGAVSMTPEASGLRILDQTPPVSYWQSMMRELSLQNSSMTQTNEVSIQSAHSRFTRWAAGVGFGSGLTKASLDIANLSFIDGAYMRFIRELEKYIGPMATVDINFWRWQMIDYAFGIISAGLAYLGLHALFSKIMPRSKFRGISTVIGTILTSAVFAYAGEVYGNITAFKGVWNDPKDWLAEFGGLSTFLLTELLFTGLKKRGLTLALGMNKAGKYLFDHSAFVRRIAGQCSTVAQIPPIQKGIQQITPMMPKVRAVTDRLVYYASIALVGVVSIISFSYFLKLF
jgi:hypothetical protein